MTGDGNGGQGTSHIIDRRSVLDEGDEWRLARGPVQALHHNTETAD